MGKTLCTYGWVSMIILKGVEKGQVFLRYSNTATDKGSFLTTTRFSSPSAAVEGLYLAPYGNTAQYVQKVTTTQRTMVLQGGVANGGAGVNQTLMINREAFKIFKGTTY